MMGISNMHITKAKARVLSKAASGFVMISGGFSGEASPECIRHPKFDRRSHIEWLLTHGLLVPGEGANQFVLSNQGIEEISNVPKSFRWKENQQTQESKE